MRPYLLKACLKNKSISEVRSQYKLSPSQISALYDAYMFEESLNLYANEVARLKNIGHMFFNSNNMLVDKGFNPYVHDTYNEYLKSIKGNEALIARMGSNKASGYQEIRPEPLTKKELTERLIELEKYL